MDIKLFRQLWHRLVTPNRCQGYLCLETRRMIPALSLNLLLLSLFQLSSQKTLKLSSSLYSYRGPPLRDPETGKHYIFLTNNFKLAAKTIADIYKARWQVELFIKWIKQNLKIKSFIGTSKNAVMTQAWIALCVYLLLAFIKFQSKLK